MGSLWDGYRLGDAIRGNNMPSRGFFSLANQLCLEYPGSIVCDYTRRTHRYNDCAALANIVRMRHKLYHSSKSFSCDGSPPTNTTVVHLRLGDSLINDDCFINPCIGEIHRKKTRVNYVKTKDYYSDIRNMNIAIVTNPGRIMEAKHSPMYKNVLQRSEKYLSDFVNAMEGQGNRVVIRRNCRPDEDFVYAVMAAHFVPAGGGFSKIINCTRTALGSNMS